MPHITFVDTLGASRQVTFEDHDSVMSVAVNNDVPGLLGECGGDMSCGTCHVYVDTEWTDAVGKPSEAELEMLEVSVDPRPESRLGCQIELDARLDGLTVTVVGDGE